MSLGQKEPHRDRVQSFATYEDAEDYLRSFTDYERMVKGTAYPDDLFDLRRIEALLARIGNPHRSLRGIHIAGTKGKGSTAVFVDAILRAHGIVSGLYTSPHLVSKEERIRVDGRCITKDEFLGWMNHLGPHLMILKETPTPPTFFDIMTAISFLHFEKNHVGAAVMEVGLGGRLDSTNVFLPEVSMITTLGLDHTDKLGSTLDRIAYEKAGIIKPGVRVISHPQLPEAARVIRERSRTLNAPVETIGEEILLVDDTVGEGRTFSVVTPKARYDTLRLSVLGRHQKLNAAAAIRAAEIFLEGVSQKPLTQACVRETMAAVHIPGRIDVIGQSPLVVVDGAHNSLSVKVLLETVKECLTFTDLHVLFACSRDKDILSMLRILIPSAARWTLTIFDFPRIEDPAKIREMLLEESPNTDVHVTEDPSSALKDAHARSAPDDLILCCGSFYLVGEILKIVRR